MEMPHDLDENLHFYVGKGVYVAMMPVNQERFYMMYLLPKNRVNEIKKIGIDRFKERILASNAHAREILSRPLSALSSWARERIFRAIDKNPAIHDKILHTVAGVQSEPYHLYDKWRALHLWAPV